LARVCAALYQCRLLALTLPTITLFLSTEADATSAVFAFVVPPPCPIPARHIMPLAPICPMHSDITCPTPVHSRIASGSNERLATLPE
jgi:hypothetical protein